MLSQFATFLRDVGLPMLAQQCESDSEKDFTNTEKYNQLLYTRVMQQDDIHDTIYSLLQGIMVLFKQRVVKRSQHRTDQSSINISYRSSESAQGRQGKRAISQQQVSSNRKVISRSQSKESNLYVKSLKQQEKRILNQRMKELQEVSQCTFRPQLNGKPREKMQTPVFDRLAQQAQQRKVKSRINQDRKEKSVMKECTFKPTININKENCVQSATQIRHSQGAFERLYQNAVVRSVRGETPQKPMKQSDVIERIGTNEASTTLMDRLNRINLKMDSVIAKHPFQQSEYAEEHCRTLKINPYTSYTATFPTGISSRNTLEDYKLN